MDIKIEPLKEQIDNWIEIYSPNRDLFFIQSEDAVAFEEYLHDVLVVPRDEFFQHSSYKQIQLVNSYEYWNVSKEAEYIIVASPDWINNIPAQTKKELFKIQVKMNRGLVLPISLFSDASVVPKEHIVEDEEKKLVVVQNIMWKQLPYESKEHLIKALAQEWDDWNCYEIPEQAPLHLRKYANTFSTMSGSNCLAATLFAISNSEWIIHEWVHPKTFEHGLKRANYILVDDDLCDGDVVTWVNPDGVVQHASYYIGNNLFFNKYGQTFFNPWKIVSWDELREEWKRYKINIYRGIQKAKIS